MKRSFKYIVGIIIFLFISYYVAGSYVAYQILKIDYSCGLHEGSLPNKWSTSIDAHQYKNISQKILRENYEAKDIEEQNEDYVRPFALVSSYSDLDEDDLPFKTNKNFKSEDARDPQSKYCIYESFVKYSEALNNIDLNLSEKNCIEAIKNSNNSVRINQLYKTEINSIRKKVNRYLK